MEGGSIKFEKQKPRTLSKSLRKESVMPPDIEPTKSVVSLDGVGENCVFCCCARADIEGPWPYEGRGGRSPSPNRFGIPCILTTPAEADLLAVPGYKELQGLQARLEYVGLDTGTVRGNRAWVGESVQPSTSPCSPNYVKYYIIYYLAI